MAASLSSKILKRRHSIRKLPAGLEPPSVADRATDFSNSERPKPELRFPLYSLTGENSARDT
jgi:hypothetical protein